LVVNQNTTYKELRSIANKLNLPFLTDIRAFDVFQGKPLEASQKAIALAFHFSNPQATLVDEEIEASLNKLIAAYEAAGANIRK
jgi:phenylalanyl-tRNA synthetase beta chain